MRLADNWRDVLKKAWSIRLMILPLWMYGLPRGLWLDLPG